MCYLLFMQVLDVGHNQLMNVSVTNLMASQISLLDMSLNTQLKVDPREYKAVKSVSQSLLTVQQLLQCVRKK